MEESEGPGKLSAEECAELFEALRTADHEIHTEDDLNDMIDAYNTKKVKDPKLLDFLKRLDSDGDGILTHADVAALKIATVSGTSSDHGGYAGYTVAIARLFRATARILGRPSSSVARASLLKFIPHSLEVGNVIKPIADARIVTGLYAIAFAYCIEDIGSELYSLHKRGYVTEDRFPMTITQCIVERSTYHVLASLVLPTVFVHGAVEYSTRLFTRIGRFQRYGPAAVGLCAVPMLPTIIDGPIEAGVKQFFLEFGPWARKKKTHSS